MVKILGQHEAWAAHDIELVAMNRREQEIFDAKVGMDKLLGRLLRRQYEGTLKLARGISQFVQLRVAKEQESYSSQRRSLSRCAELPAQINSIIDQFIRFFHTITRDQPYDATHRETKRVDLKPIYDRLKVNLRSFMN